MKIRPLYLPPEATEIRPRDRELKIPTLIEQGHYCPGDLDGLRAAVWHRYECTEGTGDVVHIMKKIIFEPSPEARSRADEIANALERWRAEADKPRADIDAAEARLDLAMDAENDMRERILAIEAKTLDGIRAKVRCAEAHGDEIYDQNGVVDDFAVSIFYDLLCLMAA